MGRVDARDVLDANGMTVRGFRGEIVGHYRRTGPNSTDDYEFVTQAEGPIEVYPRLRVQLERYGPKFRMRSRGRVIRVEWTPEPADLADLDATSPTALRKRFLERCVESFDEAPGAGAAAVIASKLRR